VEIGNPEKALHIRGMRDVLFPSAELRACLTLPERLDVHIVFGKQPFWIAEEAVPELHRAFEDLKQRAGVARGRLFIGELECHAAAMMTVDTGNAFLDVNQLDRPRGEVMATLAHEMDHISRGWRNLAERILTVTATAAAAALAWTGAAAAGAGRDCRGWMLKALAGTSGAIAAYAGLNNLLVPAEEYRADAGAVRLTGDVDAVINSYEKELLFFGKPAGVDRLIEGVHRVITGYPTHEEKLERLYRIKRDMERAQSAAAPA